MTITAELTLMTDAQNIDSSGSTRVTQEYIVRESTGAYISVSDILAADVIPSGYATYSGTNAVLRNREFKPEPNNRSVWRVKLSYATSTTNVNNFSSDPIRQPALVSFDSMVTRYAVEYQYDTGDAQGSPSLAIVNKADEMFDPPIMDEYFNTVVVIEKNYSNFDPTDIAKYSNTVNDSAMTIAGISVAAGQAWMRPLRHRTMYKEDGTVYDRIAFSIAISTESWGWRSTALEVGFTANFAGTYREITYADVNGTTYDPATSKRVSQPKRLGENGILLAAGDPSIISTFQTKYEKNWRNLYLPTRKDGTQ